MEHGDIRNTLHRGGYKATLPRLAILDVFKKAKKPLSARQVIEALPMSIDQTTVYRTFKSLREKGIIRQIDLRHNHAHYELADVAKHHHLVCVRCGRIEDVHCYGEEIQNKVLQGSKHFGEIRTHALEFYGICKKCIKTGEVERVARRDL